MIFRWFLLHQLREMKRSSLWQRNIILNILIGLMIGIMLLYLLILGLFIDKILAEIFPDEDPIMIFNGFLIYYFGIELILRFYIQSLPTLNVESYLHLPVKKSSIIHYVIGKSIFQVLNYLSWLVAIPFAIKVIAQAHSPASAITWLVSFVLLVFGINFLNSYIKRQLVGKPMVVGIFGFGLISLAFLDYFGLISLSDVSSAAFGLLLENNGLIVIPMLLVVATYLLNYYYLKSRLYPEEVELRKKMKMDSLSNIKYLETFGLTGQLIMLDLRLLWRHKRTRSILYLAPLFIGYGLFFYPQPEYSEMSGFLVFVGIFVTGGMMINFTNYCFSYDSNFFDNILANYKDLERYIRSKFILGITITTACYILTIPYVFFGTHILLINSMTFLYNLGTLSFLLIFMATFTKKRMDLSKGATFNYQGLGATHWLAMLPAFLLPVFIYLPFGYFGNPVAGLLFIGALGLIGLVFSRSLLGLLHKQFLKRRYVMAEGFRE
jgi:hypothetical protein